MSVITQVMGTLLGRWYVTAFGGDILVLAVRHLGMKRTAIYSVIALIVGAAAENGSVIAGFPYTSYTFNPALRGHELWIIDVPAMVPMSYIFLAYFAFAAARLVVSGPHATRDDSRCSNTCWQWCWRHGPCGSSTGHPARPIPLVRRSVPLQRTGILVRPTAGLAGWVLRHCRRSHRHADSDDAPRAGRSRGARRGATQDCLPFSPTLVS